MVVFHDISTVPGRWLGLAVLALTLSCQPGTANPLSGDLTALSLESLMDIQVTSVSKRPEKRTESAAAVYVITPERMRRWGVTSIPDALRMVPGLHVARIDANKWAITARGFNSRFANKLLVLIDGRSVYTPLFAGVYWESQDLPLHDIERIEVIRGSGGTLWGANAVNGVINIITRSARDTQGTHASVTVGDEDRLIGSVRHGGTLAPDTYFRTYAKLRDQDDGHAPGGANDAWQLGQAGFRVDWSTGPDSATLQGDYYRAEMEQRVSVPISAAPGLQVVDEAVDLEGGNLLGRWRRRTGDSRGLMLQGYLDYVSRDGTVLYEDRITLDLEAQYDFELAEGSRLVSGLGYRHTRDDTRSNPWFGLVPSSRNVDLWSTFVQIEHELLPNELTLTLGTKLEHNDFTGFEYQPNLRVSWVPSDEHTFWGAVSRAVRTPARGEHGVRLRMPAQPPPQNLPWMLHGNEDFVSERLVSYELGYRWQTADRLSLDLALFHNDYDDLRTFDIENASPPTVTLPFGNRMQGESHGLEATLEWQPSATWRVEATYSYLDMDLELVDGSMDAYSRGADHASPRHQATLSSFLTLRHGWELDGSLRYVGDIDAPTGSVADYLALDLRLGWAATRDVDLSLVGRNLLQDHHREYHPDFIQTQGSEVERSFHLNLQWSF